MPRRPPTQPSNQTILDAIVQSLIMAAEYDHNDVVPPAVVLWTDKDSQWEALIPKLCEKLPQILVLGDYKPDDKTGPGIWIRCMIARKLPEANWPEKAVPILYCPNVSRQELRAVEECQRHLQPIVELQYRGVYWTQVSHRDWTIRAFLETEYGGCGLDVAADSDTADAMKTALLKLADIKIVELQGRKLEASDFLELLNPDPIKALLNWMDNPEGEHGRLSTSEWKAFRSRCKSTYGFDPNSDGDLKAGELLGLQQGQWTAVWNRFAEAPSLYKNIPELLRRSKPSSARDLLGTLPNPGWPQDNEALEAEARRFLIDIGQIAFESACDVTIALDTKHAERRNWVWATLGQAPLANALQHLKTLAEVARQPIGGLTAKDMADEYAKEGWQADLAALNALACVEHTADVEAVHGAIRTIYKPWLEKSAEQFQTAIKTKALPDPVVNTDSKDGCCILFADGLRYDVAMSLAEILQDNRMSVQSSWNWAAFPTVTPTAKPAVSPVREILKGSADAEDFLPITIDGKKTLNVELLRKLLFEQEYQVLFDGETGDPSGKAWTEFGHLDSTGHAEGWKLAKRVDELVRGLVMRIQALLSAGWKEIKVVTDHGWLLLPGGLPKTNLPSFLAETKWGRCAVIKEGSRTDVMQVPWYWNKSVFIAAAPGISIFRAGSEYAHGGLSVQECVIPEMRITSGTPQTVRAQIVSVRWTQLRCKIEVLDAAPGCTADIREKATQVDTSIVTETKQIDPDGKVSLLVKDDSKEGHAATVVILDQTGKVIAKSTTEVGA